MRAILADSDTLMAIRPLDIAAYLRFHGWRPADGESSGRAVRWLLQAEEEYELLLPLDRAFRDFPLRLSEALKVLSAAEERSELEVLHDLTVAAVDVVRIRAQSHGVEDGSLPIEDGVALVEQSRNMMLAAACSAVEPRPQYPTRKPTRAVEYLRNLRLGQTERGSYVVTLISPVPPQLTADEEGRLFADIEEPFERRVVRTLASGLQSTKRAAASVATRADGIEVFWRGVEQGISANLCEALAELSGEAQRGVTISFAWSLTRPAPEALFAITFDDDAVPIISEAARVLREASPQPDVTLTGSVYRLERAGEEAGPGRISVLGVVDGEVRRATLDLGPDDYDIAITAHRDGRIVSVRGDLVREGRGFALATPRDFRLLPE
jgi:hypothetical protein